jgi:hypothetical protein
MDVPLGTLSTNTPAIVMVTDYAGTLTSPMPDRRTVAAPRCACSASWQATPAAIFVYARVAYGRDDGDVAPVRGSDRGAEISDMDVDVGAMAGVQRQ